MGKVLAGAQLARRINIACAERERERESSYREDSSGLSETNCSSTDHPSHCGSTYSSGSAKCRHARENAENNNAAVKRSKAKTWKPTHRDIYILIAVIAIPQLILWLIAWPGIYAHDAPFHILQMTTSGESEVPLQNSYSVIYSVLLGGAIKVTKSLGQPSIGFVFVMCLQIIVVIFAQVKSAVFLGNETSSRVLFWLTACFFAIHPFILMMRISTCQDTFFSAFLLLAIVEALKMGKSLALGREVSLREGVKFVVYIVLMCLFRNNGIYLYIFAVVLLIPFLFKRKLKKTSGLLILPFVLVLVITGPIYKVCGVVDSGSAIREMMSVPSQQLARAYANNPDSFSEEELEEYANYYTGIIGDMTWYWEGQELADNSKWKLNKDAVRSDLFGFAKFYLQIGAKNIGNYRDAFLMNTLGWWYPLKEYPDSRMWHQYMYYNSNGNDNTEPEATKIPRASLFQQADNFITEKTSNGAWNRIPVFNILFNTGTYTWIFFTLCAIAILNRRTDARFAFFIILGLFLTYMLSPLCYFRYSFAMITCIPVLMLVCFANKLPTCQQLTKICC